LQELAHSVPRTTGIVHQIIPLLAISKLENSSCSIDKFPSHITLFTPCWLIILIFISTVGDVAKMAWSELHFPITKCNSDHTSLINYWYLPIFHIPTVPCWLPVYASRSWFHCWRCTSNHVEAKMEGNATVEGEDVFISVRLISNHPTHLRVCIFISVWMVMIRPMRPKLPRMWGQHIATYAVSGSCRWNLHWNTCVIWMGLATTCQSQCGIDNWNMHVLVILGARWNVESERGRNK